MKMKLSGVHWNLPHNNCWKPASNNRSSEGRSVNYKRVGCHHLFAHYRSMYTLRENLINTKINWTCRTLNHRALSPVRRKAKITKSTWFIPRLIKYLLLITYFVCLWLYGSCGLFTIFTLHLKNVRVHCVFKSNVMTIDVLSIYHRNVVGCARAARRTLERLMSRH